MIQSPAGYQSDVRIKRYLDFYQAGYGVAMLSSGVAFSPLSLFANGEQGGWYDPSDLTTLYQDAAGTTPVTSVEQPVGLVLDKSRGLVLGSELVTNGDFSTDTWWSKGTGVTITGGQCIYTNVASGDGVNRPSLLTSGSYYEVTFTLVSITAGAVRIWLNGNRGTNRSVAGTYTERVTCGNGAQFYLEAFGTTSCVIDNVSIKLVSGSHLSQSTAAARPVLSARVNLLTRTEEFDNAAWATTNATISPNTTATTDPLGGNTADKLIAAGSIATVCTSSAVTASGGTQYVLRVNFKAAEKGFAFVQINEGATVNASFVTINLSTGVVGTPAVLAGSALSGLTVTSTAAANGFWTLVVTWTLASGNTTITPYFGCCDAQDSRSVTSSGTSGIYIWGADLRPANAGVGLPAYQRVGAATSGSSTAAGNADYDSGPEWPRYLRADGTDDGFQTGNIDFSGTDKIAAFAGVRKLSESAVGVVAELTASASANAGAFTMYNYPATTGWGINTRGSAAGASATSTGTSGPVTNVIGGIGDIAGDIARIRVNGVQAGESTADQGTGNYANAPLYVGRRGGTTLPFNGHIYGLVIVGRALTAAEISSMESWMAAKTGVTL